MKRYGYAALTVALMAAQFVLFNLNSPCEDAHILMRVSDNIAAGNGPVYNIGEQADVATELLHAYMLAGAKITGWRDGHIGIGALALSIVLMVFIRRGVGLGGYLILAASPLAYYIGSGFGTPIFAALVALAAAGILKRRWQEWILVAVGTLARPEFLLLFVALCVVRYGWRGVARVAWPGAVVLFVRAAYFAGLPLSFTVKAGMVMDSGVAIATLIWIVTAAAVLVFSRKRGHIALIIALFPLVYVFSDMSMNIAFRFQFAYLPALVVAVAGVRPIVAAVVMLLSFGAVVQGPVAPDERMDVGRGLTGLNGRMLTTEAGWLPYYSRWYSSDALGLTDAHIAHNGLDTLYLDRKQYDLIVWHCYNGTRDVIERWMRGEMIEDHEWRGTESWNAMVGQLSRYAQSRGYDLVAVANVPYDCRWYLAARGAIWRQVAMSVGAPRDKHPYVLTTE